VALTTEIVTAYVTRNSIGMVDLGDLIGAVGRALGGLGQEKPEPPKPEPAVAVRASGHDLGIF
jgi:predicted transcriptional regulator